MTTYKIIAKTNGWIASRDIRFNGKTEVTLYKGLTLREAQKMLLDFFCEDAEEYFANWGLAVLDKRHLPEAYPTRADGTRMYENDSRYYEIVAE